MLILDLIIVVPILYFAYKGAVNGLVTEILNIVALVLGVFITFNYLNAFTDIIAPLFEEGASYVPFVSGAILFLGTLLMVALVAYGTKELLEAANLGLLNRSTGALFGALKSGIVVSVILLILAGFNFPAKEARNQSYTYAYVIYLAPWTYNAVAFIYPGAEDYTKTLQENLKEHNPIENLPFLNDN
ncbi:MAG: CvpA family protein [Balneolaceae bacterium]|nr:CvpA family protein [Balneolaceae bacterium]